MVTLTIVKKMFTTLVILLIISSCNYLDEGTNQYPQTISDSKNLKFYSIEPETFLKNFQQNSSNILTPISATPDPYPLPPKINESYMWTYQEYLDVSEVLAKSVWIDELNEWKLFRMYFIVDCQDPLYGFTIGDFYYFKDIEENGEALYSGREILIRPLYADITIGSGTTYPKNIFGWKSINLSNVAITANNALQIAERIGGGEFRLSVKNDCQVSLSFNPNSGYGGWKILYNSNNTESFKVQIDAYNGEYRIIK